MNTNYREKISIYIEQLQQHVRIPLFATAYTLIINQMLSAALGMLYWALAARLFSAEVVGQNSALISSILLLGALAEFSLKSAMGRFVPRAGRYIKRLIIGTYLVNTAMALLITGAFFHLGNYFSFTRDLLVDAKALPLVLLLLPNLWTIFYVQDGVLTGLREAKWVLYENQAYNIIKIVLLVGIFFTGSHYGLAISWFLPVPIMVAFVNIMIFVRFIPRYLQEHQDLPALTLKEVATSVSGDHIGTVLAETGIRILPLLVLNMLGKSASAYFYEAWLIGNTIYLIASNFSSSFAVEASSNRQKIIEISHKILIQKTRLIIPLALAVFLFAPIGLSIFGTDYAREGTDLLRWLALAAIPMILNIWYLGYARVTNQVGGIIRNQGLICLITLGLSYGLIGVYGITSIGIAWFIAQFSVALVVLMVTGPILFGREEHTSTGQMDSLTKRMRRADWRFLSSNVSPKRSLVFTDGLLAEAVESITRGETVRGQNKINGEFELAVAVNPKPAILESISSILNSEGMFYSEWSFSPLIRPAGIRKQLHNAGFSRVKLFWAYPSVSNPRVWIPLNTGTSAYAYLTRFLIHGDRTWHVILRNILGMIVHKAVSWGFVPRLSAIAYKTSPHEPDVMDVIRKEWAAKNVDADRLTYLMQTSGSRLVNKIIYLVFAPNQTSPSWIIKLPRIPVDIESIQQEESVLNLLRSEQDCRQEIILPNILFSCEWSDTWISAQSALYGIPLGNLVRGETLDQIAERLTDWQITFANISSRRDSNMTTQQAIDVLSAKLDLALKHCLTSEQVNLSKKVLNQIKAAPLVCNHNDFVSWNIVQTPLGLGVFDWTSAEWNGLPMIDLIYGLTNLALLSEKASKPSQIREVYSSLLDQQTTLGKLFDRCLTRYAHAVGVSPALIPSLRLATWITHCYFNYMNQQTEQELLPSSNTQDVCVCSLLFMHEMKNCLE